MRDWTIFRTLLGHASGRLRRPLVHRRMTRQNSHSPSEQGGPAAAWNQPTLPLLSGFFSAYLGRPTTQAVERHLCPPPSLQFRAGTVQGMSRNTSRICELQETNVKEPARRWNLRDYAEMHPLTCRSLALTT